MPLSDHEQRLLEQMERALYAEDPKFATSLRGRNPRSNHRRRIMLAAVGFALGLVLLMTGLVAQLIPVSILGFLLMLGCAFFAVTSYRAVSSATPLGVVDPTGVRRPANPVARSGRRQRGSSGSSGAGFMARMEERWNRRRDENGR